MPVVLHTVVAVQSHIGHVRQSNQDAWSYSASAGVFVVCDGMGGVAGGDVASQLAVEAFLEHLSAVPSGQRSPRTITQAVCAANRRVQARAARDRQLHGMGTTLVSLIVQSSESRQKPGQASGHGIFVAHVGDSRCYRLRRGTLTRYTEDHSLIAEQLRMGVVTEEQAAFSPVSHMITRAIGTRRGVLPEVQSLTAEEGDLFLLCTDGLTRELPDAAIEILLKRPGPSLETRTQSLIEAALAAGGRDNVTALLVEFG